MNKILEYIKTMLSYLIYESNTRNENLVIFHGYNGEKYNFNSKYLFEYFLDKKIHKQIRFIINDNKLRKKLNKEIGNYFISSKNMKDIKMIINASVWITSGGLPLKIPYCNSRRIVVNLWHGLPLKGIGLMNRENTFIQNLCIRFLYSRYDIIATTSEIFQLIFSRSFNIPVHRVKITGEPWNDALYVSRDRYRLMTNLFPDKSFNAEDIQKFILYAPTWRSDEPTQLFPFSDFSIDDIDAYLYSKRAILFIRTHQLDLNNLDKFTGYKQIIFINQDKVSDIMTILNIFDVLISDYSGIIFDYLLLDRPIILLPYDLENYCRKRNMNLPFDFMTNQATPKTFNDFIYVLDNALNGVIPSYQNRLKSICHKYTDNNSCYRVIKEINDLFKIKFRKPFI